MKIELDESTITIQGVKYAHELFDAIGIFPIGQVFRIINREPDGVVTIQRLYDVENLLKLENE